MSFNQRLNILIALFILSGAASLGIAYYRNAHAQPVVHPPAPIQRDVQSELMTKEYVAALDVARVFGRSEGCANADSKLITDVAAEAVQDELDARILAATVAIESACDPMAISHSGALGLTQVLPRVWKTKFDFTKVNLLNPADNLHAGATILSDLIKQYGVAGGVRRYQGTGVSCSSCDDNYVPKILYLAGRRS